MKNNQMKLEGVGAVKALIKDLRSSQQRNLWLTIFRLAAKPLTKKTRQNIKSRHKKVKGNLIKSQGNRPIKGKAGLKVGSKIKGKFKAYHAHLLNDGTKNRYYTTKKGKRKFVGKVVGSKFFSDAVKDTTPKMNKEIQKNFKIALDRMVKRAVKKAEKKK